MRNVVIVGARSALARSLLGTAFGRDNVQLLDRSTDPATADVYDPTDVLVTLAGRTYDAKLSSMTAHQWDGAIEDNLSSVAMTLMFLGKKVRDGGNVVVVGSVVGSTGAYGAANYAAAKAGLVGLVRSAALEWAGRGVCVNLLELGFVDAGMGARLPQKVKDRVLPTIPLGRFGTESEFVHAVEFLSTVRYMTGGILTLAGGLR